jgi:hypothetical protein
MGLYTNQQRIEFQWEVQEPKIEVRWVKQSLIMEMVLEHFYHISMGGNPTINQNMNSITINSLLMWVKQCHKPPHDWEWLVDVSRHLYIIIYGDLGDGLLSFYPYYYTI